MGKSDRALVYGAVGAGARPRHPGPPWLNLVLAAVLLLELATVDPARAPRRAGGATVTLESLVTHVPVNVVWALVGVFIALAVASVVNFLLRRFKPERDWTELGQRIASWWVMAAVFTAAILLSRIASIAFLGFVSFLALKEYLSIIPTRRADRRVLLWAYLAIPIQYYWVANEWYGMFIIFVPVYMFLFLPLPMLIIGQTEGFLRAVGTLHWGLMATVFSISHMAYLLVLPGGEVVKGDGMAAGGAGLLLFLVVLTQFNDVAQYVWGRLFGQSRVIPRISPNKTWAGLLGGFFTTVLLAGWLAPYLTPFDRGGRLRRGRHHRRRRLSSATSRYRP